MPNLAQVAMAITLKFESKKFNKKSIMKAKSILFIAALFCMASCGSSKVATVETTTTEDVEVIVPCTGLEYLTSADYFRSNAMGLSNSQEVASQKAMSAARAKLAASIEVTVKTVTDNYISSYEENATEETRSRYQSLSREVINQKLNGVRVICTKTMKDSEGQYKCYVALELAGNEIATAINESVKADSNLRTDFEYQRFLEIYNEEMSNLAASQN